MNSKKVLTGGMPAGSPHSYYWRIRTGPPHRGGCYAFIKTDRRYIPEMIVDIAVRQEMLCRAFVESVDEVVEISKEEYFKHMRE